MEPTSRRLLRGHNVAMRAMGPPRLQVDAGVVGFALGARPRQRAGVGKKDL